MPDIYVDLTGLNQVHRNLKAIGHDLETFDANHVRSQSVAMGHSRVVHAFDGFVHGWTDGRERISEQITVACTKIEAAVEAYTQAEQSISGAAQDMTGGLQ